MSTRPLAWPRIATRIWVRPLLPYPLATGVQAIPSERVQDHSVPVVFGKKYIL